MIESPSSENPYPFQQVATVIRPRPLIRYLGGLIGVLVCSPTIAFPFVLIADPIGFFSEWDWGFLMVVLMQFVFVWMTYRWFTICGKLDEKSVCFRGWFKSLIFDLAGFGGTQKVYYEAYSTRIGRHQKWHYIAFDKNLNRLGKVPGSMLFCKNWQEFLDKLNSYSSSA